MSDKSVSAPTEAARVSGLRKLVEMREFLLAALVVVAFIVLSLTSPYFFRWDNFRIVLSSMSIDGIVVIGMTILLISGGFDLSVGSGMALGMIVTATLFRHQGINPWIAGAVALCVSAAVGWVIGMLVTKIKLTHFIVTLCMMGILRGLVMTLAGGMHFSMVAQVASVPSYKFLGQGSLFDQLPIQVIIFLVFAVVADFLVRRSRIMRVVFSTGSNRKAAEYSGIRTSRVLIGASIVCAVSAGVAGFIYLARFAAVPLQAGQGLEMTAISACVIGGASLTGGKGSILGSVLGLAFMAMVTNAMTLFGVSAFQQDLIRFTILLTAVALDQIQQNIAIKRAK